MIDDVGLIRLNLISCDIGSSPTGTRRVRHHTPPRSIVAPRPPKPPSLGAVESKSNRRRRAAAGVPSSLRADESPSTSRQPKSVVSRRVVLEAAPRSRRPSMRGGPSGRRGRGDLALREIDGARHSTIRTRSISQAARPREIDLDLRIRCAAATPRRGSTPERSGFAVWSRRGRDRFQIALPRRRESDLDPRIAAMGGDPHRATRHGRGRGNRPPRGGRGRGSNRFRTPREVEAPTPARVRDETGGDPRARLLLRAA